MKKLGIIAALPAEAKCLQSKKINFLKPFEIEKNIFLCVSGIGYQSSLHAAKELIKLNVNGLISWGVAGGICKSVHSGDLILAKAVTNQEKIYKISNKWHRKIENHFHNSFCKILSGDIVSTKKICATSIEKTKLFKETGALAIDMESFAMAEIAKTNNLDFIIIRSIADDANLNLPEAVIENIDNFGRLKIVKFIISCLLRPTQISKIILLAKNYKKALKSLKKISVELKKENFLYFP